MKPQPIDIRPDDLTDARVLTLLDEHLQEMASQSPPESVHALDAAGLKDPAVKFRAAWTATNELAGVAALKLLDSNSAEIKSMRTNNNLRRTGVASLLLQHLINEARSLEITSLYLETGSMPEFAAARALYRKFGFTCCKPYSEYIEDPNSVFMFLNIEHRR